MSVVSSLTTVWRGEALLHDLSRAEYIPASTYFRKDHARFHSSIVFQCALLISRLSRRLARARIRKERGMAIPASIRRGRGGRKSPSTYSWQKVPGLAAAVCCAEDSRGAHACKHYLHTFGASVGGSRKRGISPVHRLSACCVGCVCDPLRMFLSLAKSRTRLRVSQAMPAPAGSRFRS